jgi:glucoamylase
VVAERYAVPAEKRTFSSQIEVFQTGRPITRVPAGLTLRILDPAAFRVVWTMDNWATTTHTDSRAVGYPGSYVDIQTTPNQTGTIVFTLYWPTEDRWLGRNISIAVTHR